MTVLPSSASGLADSDRQHEFEAIEDPLAFGTCRRIDLVETKLAVDNLILQIFNAAGGSAAGVLPAKRLTLEKRLNRLRSQTLLALRQNHAMPEVFLDCRAQDGCARADLRNAASQLRASAPKLLKGATLVAKTASQRTKAQKSAARKLQRDLQAAARKLRKQISRFPRTTYFCP